MIFGKFEIEPGILVIIVSIIATALVIIFGNV